jgi:hypothetical protein
MNYMVVRLIPFCFSPLYAMFHPKNKHYELGILSDCNATYTQFEATSHHCTRASSTGDIQFFLFVH